MESGRAHFQAELRKKDRLEVKTLKAPERFSLVSNPEESIAFINEIRRVAESNNLFLSLQPITKLGPEAVLALTAIIKSLKARVEGDDPQDAVNAEILQESGFFEHVRRHSPVRAQPMGTALAHDSSKIVDTSVAVQLVKFAAEKLDQRFTMLGRKVSYSMLLEMASNTFDHASRKSRGTQQWWASVYVDRQRGRACFTLIDLGIGIFESTSWRDRMRRWGVLSTTLKHRGELLRELLEGKVPSRTRLSHRGKGLPTAEIRRKKRNISKLVVLSNNGFANPEDSEYIELTQSFPGTLIYWES